jgi:hypothetical protein
VVKWFRIYCWVLCVLYLLVALASVPFLVVDPAKLEMSPSGARLMGAALFVMGLGFLAASILPLVLRPRPWLWTYDVVIICLGMTSACFLPACIPLLIFWMKPEVKAYFGAS